MPRTTKAERDAAQVEIAEAFKDLPDEFLLCRDPAIGHDWDMTADFHAIPAEQVGRKLANLGRTETCKRCTARKEEKFLLVDGRIRKIGQTPWYPPGYLLSNTGAPRGVKRSEVVWSEGYRRAMEREAARANGKAAKGRTTKVRGKR